MIKVFVVVGNDYPDGVLSSEEAADDLCSQRNDNAHEERAQALRDRRPCEQWATVRWSIHEFVLDGPVAGSSK